MNAQLRHRLQPARRSHPPRRAALRPDRRDEDRRNHAVAVTAATPAVDRCCDASPGRLPPHDARRAGGRASDAPVPWAVVTGSRALTSSVARASLDRFSAAIDRGAAGDPVVALVGGDAGIGKSRLVAEAAAAAPTAGRWSWKAAACRSGTARGCRSRRSWRRCGACPASSPAAELARSRRSTSCVRPRPGTSAGSCPSSGPHRRRHRPVRRPDWVQARIFEGMLALLRAMGERIRSS